MRTYVSYSVEFDDFCVVLYIGIFPYKIKYIGIEVGDVTVATSQIFLPWRFVIEVLNTQS